MHKKIRKKFWKIWKIDLKMGKKLLAKLKIEQKFGKNAKTSSKVMIKSLKIIENWVKTWQNAWKVPGIE